jgi:hypothetical protein
MRSPPLTIGVLAGLVNLSASPPALAIDEIQVCVDAVEDGQVARQNGQLRRARARFLVCGREVCPGALRKDCREWFGEVEASLPSLVVAARTTDGRELTHGRVFVDGEEIPDALNGRAFVVDPGRRELRLDLEGAMPVTMVTVVHEGVKNRLVAIEARPAAPGALRPNEADGSAFSDDRGGARRPVPASVYIAGGASAGALAGFAYFALSGRSELSELRATCGASCQERDVSAARQKLLVGDVFLASGVVALGVATWLFLSRPTVAPRTVTFDVQAGPRQASATFVARF